MLAGAGIGAAVATAYLTKRHIFGSQRLEEKLQDYERAILACCVQLVAAIRQRTEEGTVVDKKEMRVVAEQALIPLVHQIDLHWSQDSLEKAGESDIDGIRTFKETLSPINIRKLSRHKDELARIIVGSLT